MRSKLITAGVGLALAATIAGCGSSSTAAGVVQAPSGGPTADSVTATTSSSTTASQSSTPSTPLPAALKTKPKVTVPKGAAPSKLEVKDVIKGTGPAVKSTSQTLSVQYVGVLYKNGKQFDASWDNGGQPASLPLANTIPGWQQGLIGMKVGGRRELIIPSKLAYGAKGSGSTIPPNSPLVFVIDLHGVSG